MSRSGYVEDGAYLNLYRVNVRRVIQSKRGQAFLCELATAMDAMPEKALIAAELINDDGDVCAIGVVCRSRGIDVSHVEEDNPDSVASAVGIARIMAAEIAYINDEDVPWGVAETAEQRWRRVRQWVAKQLLQDVSSVQ